jgi:hypothetical protein
MDPILAGEPLYTTVCMTGTSDLGVRMLAYDSSESRSSMFLRSSSSLRFRCTTTATPTAAPSATQTAAMRPARAAVEWRPPLLLASSCTEVSVALGVDVGVGADWTAVGDCVCVDDNTSVVEALASESSLETDALSELSGVLVEALAGSWFRLLEVVLVGDSVAGFVTVVNSLSVDAELPCEAAQRVDAD